MAAETLIHLDRNGAALCGGLQATLLDARIDRVTCPLCDAMHSAQGFLVATVGQFSAAAQRKLAELQRHPQAQAIGQFARLLIRADREVRSRSPAKGGPGTRAR